MRKTIAITVFWYVSCTGTLLAQPLADSRGSVPKNYISCSQLDEIAAPQAIQKIATQLKKQGIKKRNIKQIQYTDTIHSAQTARLEIVPEDSDNFALIKINALPFSGATDSTTAFLLSNQLANQENYIRFLEFESPESCLDVSKQIGSHITKHTKGIILVTPEPEFVRKLNFHKPLPIPVVAIHPRDYTIILRWQQLESLLATLSVTTQQEVVQRESLRVIFKGKTDEKIIVMAASSGSSVSYDALLLAQVATILKKKSAKTQKTIELVFAQSAPNSNYWLKSLQSITSSSQDFVGIILENTIHFSGWNTMGREDIEQFFKVYLSKNSATHSYPVYCGNYREIIENGLPILVHNGADGLQPCCPSCAYISPAQDTYQLATHIAQLLEKMAQDNKPLPKRLSQAEIQHFLLQHQLSEKLAFKK